MRAGAPSDVLAGAPSWEPTLSAWRGGDLLAAALPIISGSLSVDRGQQVPEQLTFRVPQTVDGFSWVPGADPYHPLARFGQFIDVTVTVTSPVSGQPWDTSLGRYQIQHWTHDPIVGVIEVECVGLLQRAGDARFTSPVVPRSSGTFASEFRRLMVGGVPVSIDAALVDRPVPQSFQWDQDRLGALYDLADAWPARILMDEDGVCQVLTPLPAVPSPVMTFTDGLRGTVISAPVSDTRDQIYNVVVARSSATDDTAHPPVQALSQVTAGPLATTGSYGPVVRFYSSPLASTKGQLQAVADKLLADSIRVARQRVVTCSPDPRIELDDPVAVVTGATIKRGWRKIVGSTRRDPIDVADTSNAVTENGWVVGYDLPLVAGDSMTVRVGVSA